MKRLDHGPDVAVLENPAFALRCFLDGNIHHGPRQVVGPNHLVGEERSKRWVDRAQEAIAEIWFLPRLHRVDVRGPEDVKAREPLRVVRSRPFPCSVRKASGSVRSGPRHSHSKMRMPHRGCWRGELARTRSGSPRLSSGVPRPTPLRYMHPGKRPLRPERRAPPRVQNRLTNFVRGFTRNYFSFVYSAFAAMRAGTSGSASFHSVKKS